MSPSEVLDDLRLRLTRASHGLSEMAEEAKIDGRADEMRRLHAKRAGVELAIDYLRAYGRPA